MTTIVYRDARPLDISNVMRLLTEAEENVEIPHPLFNPTKLAAYVAGCMVQRTPGIPEGLVKVADLSGRIVGAAVGLPVQAPWTDIWLLDITHFVVDPHFRKHGVAQNLILAIKDWVKDKKLPIMVEATTGGKQALIKDRFAAMKGLTYMGGRFLFWPQELPPK